MEVWLPVTAFPKLPLQDSRLLPPPTSLSTVPDEMGVSGSKPSPIGDSPGPTPELPPTPPPPIAPPQPASTCGSLTRRSSSSSKYIPKWYKSFSKSWPAESSLPGYVRQSFAAVVARNTPLASLGGQPLQDDPWLPGIPEYLLADGHQAHQSKFVDEGERMRFDVALKEQLCKHRPEAVSFMIDITEMLAKRKLHPGTWMRLMISTLPNLPNLLYMCTNILPRGYSILVEDELMGPFLVTFVTPSTVTYYYNPRRFIESTPFFHSTFVLSPEEKQWTRNEMYYMHVPQLFNTLFDAQEDLERAIAEGLCVRHPGTERAKIYIWEDLFPPPWGQGDDFYMNTDCNCGSAYQTLQASDGPSLDLQYEQMATQLLSNKEPEIDIGSLAIGASIKATENPASLPRTSSFFTGIRKIFRPTELADDDSSRPASIFDNKSSPPSIRSIDAAISDSQEPRKEAIIRSWNMLGKFHSSNFDDMVGDMGAVNFYPDMSTSFRMSELGVIFVDSKGYSLASGTIVETRGILDILNGTACLTGPHGAVLKCPTEILFFVGTVVLLKDDKAFPMVTNLKFYQESGVFIVSCTIGTLKVGSAIPNSNYPRIALKIQSPPVGPLIPDIAVLPPKISFNAAPSQNQPVNVPHSGGSSISGAPSTTTAPSKPKWPSWSYMDMNQYLDEQDSLRTPDFPREVLELLPYADALFTMSDLSPSDFEDPGAKLLELADKAFTPKNPALGRLTPGEWLVQISAEYNKAQLKALGVNF